MMRARAWVIGVVCFAVIGGIVLLCSPSDPDLEEDTKAEEPAQDDEQDAPGRSKSAASNWPEIRLSPAAVSDADAMHLAGRVVARETGAGIAGAELTFEGQSGAHDVVTGEEGEFAFEPPAPGRYQLAVAVAEGFLPFAPAWGQSPLEFRAREGRAIDGIAIALEREAVIRGRVEDTEGEAVAGANIALRVPAAREMALVASPASHISDPEGLFEFRAPVGTLIQGSHDDVGAGQTRLTADVAQRGELVLVLEPGLAGGQKRIAGTVVDDHGAPVPDAEVRAVQEGAAPFDEARESWSDHADSEGRFELVGLSDGSYVVTASAPERVTAVKHAVDAGSDDVVIRMDGEGGFIEGRVIRDSDGEPVPGFAVLVARRVSELDHRPVEGLSVFDSRGEFVVGPLEPDTYVVRAAADGYPPSDSQTLTVRSGEAGKTELRVGGGGALEGKVVDAEDKRPIAEARVSLEGQPVSAGLPIHIETGATTDADGTFVLEGIAPGLRSVAAGAAGYRTRLVSALEISEGETTGPIEIEITPSSDPDAEPGFELEGIGAALGPEGDVIVIGQVLDDGGAEEAGLSTGEEILAIDGRPVGEMEFDAAIQRIRGPVGTTVSLRIRGEDGEERTVAVPRRKIEQ